MNTINLVEVEGMGLYTFEAYNELKLQMSTGDYHTHKHRILTCDASLEYIDFGLIVDQYDNETYEFFTINENND